jgi:para-nitrobenzyl esterase
MIRRNKTTFGTSLLLSAVLTAGMASAPVVADENNSERGGPVVKTAEGPIQGIVKTEPSTGGAVYEFLGIPYAAPPVGNLRWMPPQPVAHWSAPLDATKFGNTCAQATTLGVFAGPASVNEDCLFLNVFTTRLGGGGPSRGLPVLVWIHGGGNYDGESSDYDGSKLATGGPLGTPTVVVTLNYRLNLFGFLSTPSLDAEGHLHSNYGILDQQAVLQWVQRNAAAFGGDPTRVLLGGQSAGATDTGLNQMSPLAKGFFNRALYESAPLSSVTPYSVGLADGTAFAVAAGCGSGSDAATSACLRALSASQILQLEGTANTTSYDGMPSFVAGPVQDGTIIPHNAIYAWTTGNFNHMPTMGGNVQDEQNFTISIDEYFSGSFMGGLPYALPTVGGTYPTSSISTTMGLGYINDVEITYTGAVYPGGPNYPSGTDAAVLAQYPSPGQYDNAQPIWDLEGTHPGVCRDRIVDALWAQWSDNPVYEYEFNDQNAPYYFPNMPGFTPLAAHTIDIQFLFPLWHGGILGVSGASQSPALTPQEETLSNQLVAAWTYFAATGNPNPSGGNSPWPRFVNQSGTTTTGTGFMYPTPAMGGPLFLSENVPALSTFTWQQFSANHNCGFWDSILYYQPPS